MPRHLLNIADGFGFWIVGNLHLVPGVPASVEAIFLSTFVLISQNRMAGEADKRADLDLQISLLTEHELTQVVTLLNQMASHLGIEPEAKPELRDASKDIAPERVLDKIEEAQR